MQDDTLIYSRSKYDEENLNLDIIYKLITVHASESKRLKTLKDYYLGKHDILNHKRRSNFTKL